jgi:hypothetical protein
MVLERHDLILATVGAKDAEVRAASTMTLLMWLLPLIMVLGAAVDLALMVAYLKWLHPWKIILQQVRLFMYYLSQFNNTGS